MKQLILLLLLQHSLSQMFEKKKCAIDHRSTENMWEYKLKKDLGKCGLNQFKPPILNGTEPLKIGAYFVMKSFKFDSELQEFSTYMTTIISWEDERVKWNPDNYDGVKTVPFLRGYIWAPEFRLINNIGDDEEESHFFIPCELEYTGKVNCIAWIVYEAKCSTDLRDWPYDAQYCNLQFGLVNSEVNIKMQLDLAPRAITMFGAEYGAEWDIMDYQQTMNDTSEQQLVMKFRLERHAEVLVAIVIYPSLILSTLTLSSLFLDARLNLRLLVICFSLFCHNYFITDLSFEIPENTKDPPTLLMYYRGSFILTSVLLVVSFVLNAICRRKVVCPNWVKSINNFVFLKFVKFVFWPRWDFTIKNDISASNFVKDWIDIANVVNTFCLFMSMIVYISLYCVFMPHPIPFN